MGMGPLRASLKRKAASIGGGLELVWLPVNQAWAAFWHGQRVAGPFNHEHEVEEFLSRYDEPSSGGGKRRAAKRKRSYASRSKSSRGKKRRTLTRLRRVRVATKRRGYGVLRHGKHPMLPSILDAPVWSKTQQAMYSILLPGSRIVTATGHSGTVVSDQGKNVVVEMDGAPYNVSISRKAIKHVR